MRRGHSAHRDTEGVAGARYRADARGPARSLSYRSPSQSYGLGSDRLDERANGHEPPRPAVTVRLWQWRRPGSTSRSMEDPTGRRPTKRGSVRTMRSSCAAPAPSENARALARSSRSGAPPEIGATPNRPRASRIKRAEAVAATCASARVKARSSSVSRTMRLPARWSFRILDHSLGSSSGPMRFAAMSRPLPSGSRGSRRGSSPTRQANHFRARRGRRSVSARRQDLNHEKRHGYERELGGDHKCDDPERPPRSPCSAEDRVPHGDTSGDRQQQQK